MASFYVEVGDFERAAESYEQIHKLCPYDIEALRTGAKVLLSSRLLNAFFDSVILL